MKRIAWLALLGVMAFARLSWAAPASPAPPPDPKAAIRARYIDGLVERARKLDLAHQVTWLRLVHYRHSIFGWGSEADARSFFLSSDGKGDPEAELEATIRAFFGPEPADKKFPHAFCRFPARLAWLNSKLAFDFGIVPRRACPEFQDYFDKLRPRALVLVFSSYYLNNPASAFGHTFLRVNKQREGDADEEGLELLDYGVDYSATVDTNNALIYGIKGLTGLFPGVFRKIPYYLKVREYNDFDSRDLWEYELNLSREELSMVIAHLWELGFNYFDYFYLSENCSYHVLAAIEVASPRLNLLSHLGWPVLPADTVKVVHRQPGLVKKVTYRPSIRSQFRARLETLNDAERDMLASLFADPDAPFPRSLGEQSQARVLDTALDLADFRYARDVVRKPGEESDPEGARLKQRFLERRAKLSAPTEDVTRLNPPLRKMPHYGHGSARLGLGSGYLQGRGAFHTAEVRLALHDLADASPGYPDSAAIEFLSLKARYYVEDPRVSLESAHLIKITSLTPLTRFEKSFSWSLRAGMERFRDSGCPGCLAGIGEFGGGYAVGSDTGLVAWALADAQLIWPVDRGGLLDRLRLGIGPSGGLRLRAGEDLAFLAAGSWHWLPGQHPRGTWDGTFITRWQYLDDFAFSLELNAQPSALGGQLFSMMYF